MTDFTSDESIRESVRKEAERFENQLKIASDTGHPELAALMGTRISGSGEVMDYHGKYAQRSDIDVPGPIKRLQEQPYFNAYRTIFENATFHMFGDRREHYREDLGNILVYEAFKEHIPTALRDSYRELFEKSYIDYFTGITRHNGTFNSSSEKIEYLNSKGIRAVERSGGWALKWRDPGSPSGTCTARPSTTSPAMHRSDI